MFHLLLPSTIRSKAAVLVPMTRKVWKFSRTDTTTTHLSQVRSARRARARTCPRPMEGSHKTVTPRTEVFRLPLLKARGVSVIRACLPCWRPALSSPQVLRSSLLPATPLCKPEMSAPSSLRLLPVLRKLPLMSVRPMTSQQVTTSTTTQ